MDSIAERLWQEPTVYRSDLFAGHNVLVSGGGSGIGRAIALLLARLGAQVIVCGRTLEKLERVAQFARHHGARMLPIATNVREPEQVEALFARIGAECGTLAAVVNNAGGQFAQPAIDFSVKGLERGHRYQSQRHLDDDADGRAPLARCQRARRNRQRDRRRRSRHARHRPFDGRARRRDRCGAHRRGRVGRRLAFALTASHPG